MPDQSRGDGPVEARVQDGKREAFAQGVLSGGPGVGADQVPVGGQRPDGRPVPTRFQLGGGAQQEPQARRVGHTAVQAQAGGVRRQAGGGGGGGCGRTGKDAHPHRAAAVVRQLGVRRVARVVHGRRRRGQIVRRPARRRRRCRPSVAHQTEQVSVDGWRRTAQQQQDAAHTRGAADAVPVPRLRVVRRRAVPVAPTERCDVERQQQRGRQRPIAGPSAAGRRTDAPAEEHRILLAPHIGDRHGRGTVAASQPVSQLRLGTVGQVRRPNAAQKTVTFVVTAAAQQRQKRRGR